MTAPTLGLWLAAAAPVLLLVALVVSGKLKTHHAALVVAVVTVVLALAVFDADAATLAVGLGKGVWLGSWILYVVLPAMLLYRIAERAGFERIGGLFQDLFPDRSETVLVLAWLLPSFIQGVAGFGAPIAVVAPLLLSAGWKRHQAVAYPLIGYHWSVTFGSMGSSFYMAQLTAQLGRDESRMFADHASILLGVNCLLAGLAVLLLDGGLPGLRRGWRLLLGAGVPMAVTLHLVTGVVPGIGSVAAGAVGFACAIAMSVLSRRRAVRRGERNGRSAYGLREAVVLTSPYLWLLGTAMMVMLVPPIRHWAEESVTVAPGFPATMTGIGHRTAGVDAYTPLHLLTHPGTFLLLAAVLGQLTYRAAGVWRSEPVSVLVRSWWRSVRTSVVSMLALATVTTMVIQSGMMATLARGIVAATGTHFPYFSALVGATGSFLTGSTTTSNALFSALQSEVATLIHVPRATLLAAQTAGGNIGNSIAPVVLLIGINAVGGGVSMQRIIRIVLGCSAGFLVVATALTQLLLVLDAM